jgi:hypothetical protein
MMQRRDLTLCIMQRGVKIQIKDLYTVHLKTKHEHFLCMTQGPRWDMMKKRPKISCTPRTNFQQCVNFSINSNLSADGHRHGYGHGPRHG